MTSHIPYEKYLKRNPDFIVKYQMDLDEALSACKPIQGMRVDFLYHGDDIENDGVYMIWPEILDENGMVQLNNTPGEINQSGFANMWIVNDEFREYHKTRIKIGTRGQWWRGGRIARVEVVKVVGL